VDFQKVFGPSRGRGEPLEKLHADIASSLQKALEETVLELARWLQRRTGSRHLCLAGGVALNCVMNARLRDKGPFQEVWVQPAAGDAGTALGAALWIDAKERRNHQRAFRMEHAYLGPAYSEEEIEKALREAKLSYHRCEDVAEETADLLAEGHVVGWFQGRMEFGPRALGARSILASPLKEEMRSRLNFLKDREDFRPVAPVVLEEEAAEWFTPAGHFPFMTFICDLRPDKAEIVPAVRHVDGTARPQTVRRTENALYYDLIKAFQRRTGVPLLINTSFNTRSEPMVRSPQDALACFWTSPFDALVLGPFLLEKNPAGKEPQKVFAGGAQEPALSSGERV
jgi:carbamoyltransferase